MKRLRVKDWNPRDRADRLWLAVVVLVALTVRLIVVWELLQNNAGFFLPDVDSGWHYTWAQELARGNWLGSEVFYRAPLYPYLLGIWFTILGEHLLPVRLVQALIGALSAGLVTLLGWRALGRRIGLTAGFIWALWGPMIYYETELLIPVLIVPLNLLALWLASGFQRERMHRFWPWLLVGGILGISAIARPNILIAVPALLWMAWASSRTDNADPLPISRRAKALVALLIGAMLPILPVTARNYVVGNDMVLLAYQGGVNLYIGNNPDADGLTMQMPEVLLEPTIGWDRFVGTTDSIARVEAGRELRPSEISNHWTGKALEYIGSHPIATMTLWMKKAYFMLNGFEVGDQTDIYAFTRHSLLLNSLIHRNPIYIPFGLVGPFALVGMVWIWLRVPRLRPLVVFIMLYAVSVVLFLATARHRLPILPLMAIFAAAAFWLLYGSWQRRQTTHVALAVAGVVVLGIALNRPTVENIMHNPAFTYYQEAIVHDRRGDFPKAIELYRKALKIEPMLLAARRNLARALMHDQQYDEAVKASFDYLRHRQHDAEAMNNLGLAYLGQGDTSKALGSFRIAARENPKLPQPHLNLGDIALARGEAAAAAGAYGRSINADSSYGAAYNALGILLARAGLFDSATTVLRLCTEKNPYYASAWANLGNVLLESGQHSEAIEAMNRALELTPEATTIRYNLAAAHAKAGNIAEAKRQLEILLNRDPTHAEGQQLLKTIRNTAP